MCQVHVSNTMIANTDVIDGLDLDREDFDIDDNDDAEDEFSKIEKLILEAAPSPDHWYHGRLDRKQAEERLQSKSAQCSYLVRESTGKSGIYSLSYLSLGKTISHFRITAICGDYYIGGRKFQSLPALIGYYSTYGSLMKDEKLKHPVAPPEPVHLAHRVIATFPYTASPDCDELSFDIGDVFSVQNVLDNDWLWVVAQKDNKSGLVPYALMEELEASADPYEGQSWFCNVDKQNAQTILMNFGGVGSFLIRPSEKQGDYSISLRDHTGVCRYLIRRQGRHFVIGGRPFDSVEDIIKHYNTEQLAEGVSLGKPVERAKYESFLQSIRGSVIKRQKSENNMPVVTPRRMNSRASDNLGVTKCGFLNMRGGRNKWRRLYMELKGEDQQLLYYENEKRTKPKGLFDLNYASVYKVHETLFGRANCLQIVLRALNETQTNFVCAETSDAAQEWFESITKYCGKMRSQSMGKQKTVKELRSLELTICHAQKIPVSKLPHPYCIVSLNDIKTCKTKAKDAPEPAFDEEFKFDDLHPDVTSFTVALYNRKTGPYKDKEMARVTIFLNTLEPGKVLDQWFTLGSLQHKSEMGSIRLTAKFIHEIIMPVDEYRRLKELLTKDYSMVQSLGDVSKDLNILAYTLLRIFRHSNSELLLIKTIIIRELKDKEKKETLFRGNSLATKLMDQYMKMTAIPYLQKTIKSVIMKIVDSKQCCELNPARVEKGSNVAENLQQLIKFLEEITSNIFNSVQSCPKPLRYLFHCLQQEATKTFPGDDSVKQRVVSAFLFLRLIVPGILYPKMHNLVNESPSQMSSRTLTLVASCLQKLANLVEFGAKEPYLAAVNPFLAKYRSKMTDFLDEISDHPEQPSVQENFKYDLARDLANIHETCIRYEPQLMKLSSTQANVKILLAIVEGIKRQKEQYMNQAAAICEEAAI